MTTFRIIVGSVMGTAQELANQLNQEIQRLGHTSETIDNFDPECHDISRDADVWLICSSNTGMGDLPANINPFYQHLVTDFPRIFNKPYGIVNLGDSSYPNFAQSGQTLDAAMSDLGANRVGEVFVIDALETAPEDYTPAAIAWLAAWLPQAIKDITPPE